MIAKPYYIIYSAKSCFNIINKRSITIKKKVNKKPLTNY